MIPVNPAAMVAGKAATPAQVEHVAHVLYLDRPLYVQYGHFLKRAGLESAASATRTATARA